jgi:exosortase J
MPLARPAARFTNAKAVLPATALSLLGVYAVFTTAQYLWQLWTSDPLKSIGGFVPLLSLFFILRAWRGLGWEMRGTWWGLVVLAATVMLVHLRDHAILELVLSPSWAIFLPPHSLVAVAYVSGAVLLFGGTRLFRAALFPILLMWLVNPVPHFFTLHVDLPLQHEAAKVARAFAHALGQPLTPDQLRLMFTPDFGMFIAPGCDGIRGAITMGLIALAASYFYRFRWWQMALVTFCAVLLGYVFNFIRLCTLVLYYIVALHFKWLQSRAEMGDYVIGALLFLLATVLLFTAIRRFGPTGDLRPPKIVCDAAIAEAAAPRSFWWRWSAFALLVIVGSMSYLRAEVRERDQVKVDPETAARFPQQIGQYHLERVWNEHMLAGGPLIFYWANYVPADGGTNIAVGVSPFLGAHDSLICHAARGDDWLWHNDLKLDAGGTPTDFSASFFNDGATQYLEATTLCSGDQCGQVSTARRHFGLIYTPVTAADLMGMEAGKPIPVMLHAETTDTALAPDVARREMTAAVAAFLKPLRVAELTRPYR